MAKNKVAPFFPGHGVVYRIVSKLDSHKFNKTHVILNYLPFTIIIIISAEVKLVYRVAQNKIPHQTICNISATNGQILKIFEAA